MKPMLFSSSASKSEKQQMDWLLAAILTQNSGMHQFFLPRKKKKSLLQRFWPIAPLDAVSSS